MSNKSVVGYEDIATYDELPLWSAPFGNKLLETITYAKGLSVLDIGSGTGFPSLEVAQRLGRTSFVYGLDTWDAGIERAEYKAKAYQVENVKYIKGSATKIPFENESFELIISNNGINNTGNEFLTLQECYRVCKQGGELIFTVNLPETMRLFYQLFKQVLVEQGHESKVGLMEEHIVAHRKTAEELSRWLEEIGFIIDKREEDVFSMSFADGTAMLNYHFIRHWFVPPWLEIMKGKDEQLLYQRLEEALNEYAKGHEGIKLEIPYICFKCIKG